MAFDILNSTTLNGAVDKEQVVILLTASTNVSVDDILVVGGEAIKVQAVDDPASNYVRVLRGALGTVAWSHASGDKVWIADEDDLASIPKGRLPFGAEAQIGLDDTNTSHLPFFALPGTRALDGKGNEFIAVELTAVVYKGVTCVISKDGSYTAAPLAAGTSGSVGIATEQATSDQITWLQIRGYNSAAQEAGGTSGATSSYLAAAATSVSSPATGLAAVLVTSADQIFIQGMFIQGAASTATTSATSATGVTVPVFLNYPWVDSSAKYQALAS